MTNIVGRVINSLALNATLLNAGILVLCGWYVATRQDIPNLLLGALIANGGNALGALGSVLNSTRNTNEPQAVNVVNTPAEAVPVDPAD